MTQTPHRRFAFDTVFDQEGGILSAPARPKTTFTIEEVETLVQNARQEGERSVVALAEGQIAAALQQIAEHAQIALSTLAHAAHEHRAGAADLALIAAQRIADAALDRFPQAALLAALDSLRREIEHEPRLIIRARPDLLEQISGHLNQAAEMAGFSGHILAKADAGLPPAAFGLEWADGRAAFDPEQTSRAIHSALATALAAEGLHAEPLLPFLES